MMRAVRICLYLFILLSASQLHAKTSEAAFDAKAGTLDLRTWDFSQNGKIALNGEWEFYWKKLYQFEDIRSSELIPDSYFPVPRRWGNFELNPDTKIGPSGFATLSLKVLLPKLSDNSHLRLFLGSSDSSFKLEAYDNEGNMLSRPLVGGEVGSNKNSYRPLWVRDSAPLEYSEEITFVWHISSFDMQYDGGGPKKPPYIGLDRTITLEQENERSFNAITTGIMLIMAAYHLIIFLLRKEEKAALWFGLACFFMAFYSVLTPHYIEQNFPELDLFESLTKLLFLSGVLPSVFHILFVRSLFQHHAGNVLWKTIVGMCLIYCLLIIFLPLQIYDYLRFTILITASLSCIWYIKVFSAAIIKDKSLIAILLATGFGIFGITALSDVLVANAVIALPYLSSYGLSAFVLFQAIVIAIQNQTAHKEKYTAQKLATESKAKALDIEQQALKEQKSLTAAFQRFVPADFLELLGKEQIQDVSLGDFTKQEMTVLFSDIRSFTTLSEKMSPEDNFKFLNSYLMRMEPVIHKNNGVIDKYIGDAIMATFPKHADNAIQAAIEMQQALKKYNEHRQNSGYDPIQIGIGINTGELMLGTIGGTHRMEGTVISDAVNLASRLEGLTKMYGASIAISSETLSKATLEKFETRILDKVLVKGKSNPVTIYEVLNEEDSETKILKLQSNEFLLKAIHLRQDKKLLEAKQTLEIGLNFFPHDLALKKHLDDIDKLMLLGIPDNWKGATILDNK